MLPSWGRQMKVLLTAKNTSFVEHIGWSLISLQTSGGKKIQNSKNKNKNHHRCDNNAQITSTTSHFFIKVLKRNVTQSQRPHFQTVKTAVAEDRIISKLYEVSDEHWCWHMNIPIAQCISQESQDSNVTKTKRALHYHLPTYPWLHLLQHGASIFIIIQFTG